MATSTHRFFTEIEYPESDGFPIAESDPTRDYLVYSVEALNYYFRNNPDVYVSGNLLIYYEQGNPKACISPDVFVVFGVSKQKRRSYKLWEENNKVPNFVIEITSKSMVSDDLGVKKGLYAFLGVAEYFQYDPTADYLNPPLKGYRLVNGDYFALEPTLLENGITSLLSQELGLELRLQGGELRFYDPKKREYLLSYQEAEQARLDAIPRLLQFGLTVEQIAEALGFSEERILQEINQLEP